MIDHAAVADRLFGGSMRTTEAPAPQPQPQQSAKTPDQSLAERLYAGPKNDYVSPLAKQGQPQQAQQQPAQAQQGEQAGQQQGQPPEAIARAAESIATTLAEQAGLDPAHADTQGFSKLAAEAGISAENAAKIAAWDAERTEQAWQRTADEWLSEAKQDVLFDDNVAAGRTLLEEFGNPRLMADINNFALGNHPGLIQMLGQIGRALERARRTGR